MRAMKNNYYALGRPSKHNSYVAPWAVGLALGDRWILKQPAGASATVIPVLRHGGGRSAGGSVSDGTTPILGLAPSRRGGAGRILHGPWTSRIPAAALLKL